MTGIEKLLIANRGEIALRVMRTADELGIATVALYTDLDRRAPHVRAAGEAIEVPGYLDIEAVVAASVTTGADAVHPGYGFLSERAPFARALELAGIRLVGPSADVMDLMGRKDAAREVAERAGVPVVPAYDLGADPATFTYPVLVKAAAGGGGKGMRVVREAADFDEALAAARREAASSFGDDAMIVERYVERGRHVEVQVMGDDHGDAVHLHERDCSAQRRHQKVLEEAPAPGLDDVTRTRMHTAAVDLARQVGYSGAGTVEFLLDPAEHGGTGDFYFLEMNTRLQVEHPVTEAVHRLRGEPVDLVAMQLDVAAGGHVPAQSELTLTGHAIEARVYAEDAFGGFLPQAGTATVVHWPEALAGVRVDHALESGQVVSTSFDPMLGKVIAAGADREAARELLVRALADTAVFGLVTNTGFLHSLASHDAFRDVGAPGGLDTAWLDRNELDAPDEAPALAAAAVSLRAELASSPHGAWQPDAFRMGGPVGPLVEDGRVLPAAGWSTVPETLPDGLSRVSTFPHEMPSFVRRSTAGTEVVHAGQWFDLRPGSQSHVDEADGDLVAPMPGTVLDVRVAEGEAVTEGQALGVLEAMKMELALKAPYDGTVTTVAAEVGRQVPLGHVLFHVEPAHAEADGGGQ
ncbi:acetyl/propionyl/methylcrotonyl-CoA carboxylase subunit alpha [Nocardioides acrostichi]|uniref:ATP-grasp domain-containing protein n=1 Tax=Nocardioides acrostichi TaxID=2784339 RepID=A0A930YEQ3_9ACTN|nr:biotin carboxylase N-terminal domain-containing protein [Nocardioides acrostichi]MBF4163704.1 ATP-grasp domain-containing protein [Nocardioides acrostichi]